MSPVKQAVRELLDRLPDDITFEDVQYQLYVWQKIERGLKDAEEGRVISHEEMKRRLSQWLQP